VLRRRRVGDPCENEALRTTKGIKYVYTGVSGGVRVLEHGQCVVVGGADADIELAMPIFDALRPEGPKDEGFVHDSIEHAICRRTARASNYSRSSLTSSKDVPGTFTAWQRGTVVRSWLLEVLVAGLERDPTLEAISGYI